MKQSSPKEAYTAIPGRTCRYRGDADHGLDIELPGGDVLSVTPSQIGAIFTDLGSYNLLLEECLRTLDPTEVVERIKATARAQQAKKLRKKAGERGGQTAQSPYAHLVSGRLLGWCHHRAPAVFGRALSDEVVLWLQSAFAGEGLLPMEMGQPGDFPTADELTSLKALVGRRVIYEENRDFLAAEVRSVSIGGHHQDEVYLRLHNLHSAGFSAQFPDDFQAGGSIEQLSIGFGRVGAYMGIWGMITGPQAVKEIIDAAPGFADRKALLKFCRQFA